MTEKLTELAQEGKIKLTPLSPAHQLGFERCFEAGQKRMDYYSVARRQQEIDYLNSMQQQF